MGLYMCSDTCNAVMNIITQTLQNDKLLYITVHNTVKQCSVSSVMGTVNVLRAVGGWSQCGSGCVHLQSG